MVLVPALKSIVPPELLATLMPVQPELHVRLPLSVMLLPVWFWMSTSLPAVAFVLEMVPL